MCIITAFEREANWREKRVFVDASNGDHDTRLLSLVSPLSDLWLHVLLSQASHGPSSVSKCHPSVPKPPLLATALLGALHMKCHGGYTEVLAFPDILNPAQRPLNGTWRSNIHTIRA